MYDTERFLKAQETDKVYETALEEIRNGKKRTHWVWFIFPQIAGLGHSQMATYYAIHSLKEVKEYLENRTLHQRLFEITRALYSHNGRIPMEQLLGEVDAMKVRSCMTLFDKVDPDCIFADVLRDCFDDTRCELTLKAVEKEYQELHHSAIRSYLEYSDEKAFFESGSYEADRIPYEQRLGTMIDLYKRRERMAQMVDHYLWVKDYSYYRLDNVRHTISMYISTVLNDLLGIVPKPQGLEVMKMFYDRVEGIRDAEDAAYQFDTIFYELIHAGWADPVLDKYLKHSLIKEK